MFWMTIRQHRTQLLVTVGLLAAFGVVLLVHGLGNVRAAAGLSGGELERALGERYGGLATVISWFPVVPLLVGLFWGAPVLAREFERGTHLLAWTQSVTRRRWVLSKLGLLGALVTVSGLALGLMINAWVGTFDGTPYAARMGHTAVFMTSGVASAGWWLFAFALGVAAAALFRRMLPAMAVTVAVFFVALFGMLFVREFYATPERVPAPAENPLTTPDGDVLVVDSAWLDETGAEIPGDVQLTCVYEQSTADCPDYRLVSYVHPADRYWRFQWTEAVLLLGLAALLGGVGYRRVARTGAS